MMEFIYLFVHSKHVNDINIYPVNTLTNIFNCPLSMPERQLQTLFSRSRQEIIFMIDVII